jgi:hypothetical protein
MTLPHRDDHDQSQPKPTLTPREVTLTHLVDQPTTIKPQRQEAAGRTAHTSMLLL